MTDTRETAPETRCEPLPPPVLVLIVSVAKANDEHFARSCKSEEWRDCDDCVDIYNRAHDQVMSILDARDAMVRAKVAEEAITWLERNGDLLRGADHPDVDERIVKAITFGYGEAVFMLRRIAHGEQP